MCNLKSCLFCKISATPRQNQISDIQKTYVSCFFKYHRQSVFDYCLILCVIMKSAMGDRRNFGIYAAFTIILSAMFGILLYISPAYVDDAWYLENFTGAPGSWEYFVTTVSNSYRHWQYDTGRLCNMAAVPFLALFPKWVFSIATAVAIWIIYLSGPYLARTGYISIGSVFWIFVVTFVFPWFDFMMTVIFCCNYVWSVALAVIYLYLLNRFAGKPSLSTLAKVSVFLFAVLLGWWHEGISVPLVAGCVTYFACRRLMPNKSEWFMLIGLVCGVGLIVMMPAFRLSVSDRESVLFKPVLWETIVGFCFIGLFFVYAVLLGVGFAISSIRRRLTGRLPMLAAILAFDIVGVGIFMKYYSGPRVGAFVQLASAIGIMIVCGRIMIYNNRKNRALCHVKMCGVVFAFILSFISLWVSLVVQPGLTREYDEVKLLSEINRGKNPNVVFFDPTCRRLGIDMYKPSYKALTTPWGLEVLNNVTLVPTAFKDLTAGNAGLRQCSDERLYLYKNHIVVKGKTSVSPTTVWLYTRQGDAILSRVEFREFKDVDGNWWTYVVTKAETLTESLEIKDACLSDSLTE